MSYLQEPGEVDITADVDFQALRKVVENSKSESVKYHGPIPQGYFLCGLGIEERVRQMAETVREIGAEPLVLETDAPYLAPVPKRGKRNESSYIPIIAEKVAEIIGVEAKKIEEITTKNAMNLFNLHSENV